VFEHVSQDCLDATVADLRNVLRDGGHVFLQIAPLYYSADGGHLFELSPEPWAHLTVQTNLLQHHVINAPKTNAAGQLINAHGNTEFQKYKDAVWSCFQTLNKITADEVIELYRRNGFRLVQQRRTECKPEPNKTLKRLYHRD